MRRGVFLAVFTGAVAVFSDQFHWHPERDKNAFARGLNECGLIRALCYARDRPASYLRGADHAASSLASGCGTKSFGVTAPFVTSAILNNTSRLGIRLFKMYRQIDTSDTPTNCAKSARDMPDLYRNASSFIRRYYHAGNFWQYEIGKIFPKRKLQRNQNLFSTLL